MQSQFYAPPLSPINKYILITIGSFFLVDSVLQIAEVGSLISWFSLTISGFTGGRVHTLFTYPLANKGLMSLLFDGLILWFIGSELELRWGRKTYLQFLLASVLGAGLCYLVVGLLFFSSPVLLNMPFMGLTGFCYALLFAYGVIFAERQMVFMLLFPMKAKYFCLLLAGIELYMGVFSPFGKAAWGHLAAMAVGFGFLRLKTYWLKQKSSKSFEPPHKREKAKKGRANLYLVSGGDENKRPNPDDPKYWQ